MKVTQSCLNLCDPMDYTVYSILQARILEWVAYPFSGGSSQLRDRAQISRIAGEFFTSWATREAQYALHKEYYSYFFQKSCGTLRHPFPSKVTISKPFVQVKMDQIKFTSRVHSLLIFSPFLGYSTTAKSWPISFYSKYCYRWIRNCASDFFYSSCQGMTLLGFVCTACPHWKPNSNFLVTGLTSFY